MYALSLKAGFLPVKMSSFDYANIWSLDQWLSAANGMI